VFCGPFGESENPARRVCFWADCYPVATGAEKRPPVGGWA
jgi:hypothetical protein